MSNFQCPHCGMTNIDCGWGVFKTPKEIELEEKLDEAEFMLKYKEDTIEKVVKRVERKTQEIGTLKEQLQHKTKECDKYKQALDNIEEVCTQLLDDDYIRSVAESLLDIIYETEDGDNDTGSKMG